MSAAKLEPSGEQAASRPAAAWRLFAVPTILSIAVFGWHLRDGFLSDDFLYLGWRAEGLFRLFHMVTIDSYPRMIRPVPGLVWAAGGLPGAALLLHAISIALHAVNGFLVARIVFLRTKSAEGATIASGLFVVFPFFAESVAWLSGSFDLWAVFFSLLAIEVLSHERETIRRDALSAIYYGLALLSKESVLLLPFVLVALFPWHRIRRAALFQVAVCAAYLGVRLVMFRGIGGYVDPSGQSLAASFDPIAFARALSVQLPFRMLIPLKRAGALGPAIAIISAVLLVGLGLVIANRQRIWTNVIPFVAALAALLPAAPVFRVEADHEGARLLYFPAAAFFLAAGVALRFERPAARRFGLALVVVWGAIAIANGRPWTAAAAERDAILRSMRAFEARFPGGATVMVDAHDTLRGAYLFRNGIPQAARLLGYRGDLEWERGLVSQIGPVAGPRLGVDLFEIGLSRDGEPEDFTAIERELWLADLPALLRWTPQDVAREFALERLDGGVSKAFGPSRSLAEPAGELWVRLQAPLCSYAKPIAGALFWKTSRRTQFSVTDGREFDLGAPGSGPVVIRLPEMREPPVELQLRVDLVSPVPDECLPEIRVGVVPR